MASSTLAAFRRRGDTWRVAAFGLVIAASIVGIAITAGGATARTLNGVGALFWVGSSILLALTLPPARRAGIGWIVALAAGLLLGGVVRPGTVELAGVCFAIAGALIVVAAGDRTGAWGFLAPAIYLPVHLIIGIGRAMLRESGMRTDPPPTAAILPLAMIMAAAVGASVAASIVRRST
jgi:hypothetical protein